MLSRYPLLLLLVLLGAMTDIAQAASCAQTGIGNNLSGNMGTRTVPRDAAIATDVTPNIGFPDGGYGMQCIADPTQDREAYVQFSIAQAPVAGFTDVYPTSVPGLGVRYHFAPNSGLGCGFSGDQRIHNSSLIATCHIFANTNLAWSWGTSVNFVKTGPIAPGPITWIPAVTMSYTLNGQAGSWPLPTYYSGNYTGNIVLLTCTTPSVNVNLGTIKANELAVVGSTSAEKNFNIELNNCPSGMNSVDYRLEPITQIVQSPGWHFLLDGTSTATGVGIQILYQSDSSIVPLGPSANVRVSAYNSSTGGTYVIPMKARYIRTGNITPGTANGLVNFTMTYK